MAVTVVKVEDLRKTFGELVAISRLNLTIEEGSIYGLIGPNGAGKTTLLRILATLQRPTEGIAEICGLSVTENPEEVRNLIGYMPDFFGVYDDMKVWEYMDFFGSAFKVPREERAPMIDELLTLVNLEGKKYSYVESLSRGMKQRLCLARSLINNPKLLILDEPASGLDPRTRVEIRELLKKLKKTGKTIIISSHILPELSELCTHIGVIEKGQLVVSGNVSEITESVTDRKVINIKIYGSDREFESIAQAYEHVISINKLEKGSFAVSLGTKGKLDADFLGYLVSNNVRVASYTEESPELEDIFLRITKGEVQ